MKRKLLFCLFAATIGLCLAACVDETEPEQEQPGVDAVIDILSIAGKTEDEIQSALGAPVFSENSSFSPDAVTNTYADSTEILFVDEIPARITVYPPDGAKVEDGAALIGLTEEQSRTPSYDSSENYYWNDNTEFYKITAFNNGDGTISYIYVITSEEYQ